MPRSGTPLFTTKYPDKYQVRDRVHRRKDGRYYIITGIQEVFEDGDYVYTIYGYPDPNQDSSDQEDCP